MTTTPDIQVPGQLELPLEFDKPITKTVTYYANYTDVTKVTSILTVPSSYKPLMDLIEEDPSRYQRTLESLVINPYKYEDVSVCTSEVRTVEEIEDRTEFLIK